jgi:3-hydroxyacyl-CoA dehydrogenase / enoyl-CoA hydratase / 3-hydroxybutyryl-CoA epimerase
MDATLPWPENAPAAGASLFIDEPEPGLLRLIPDPPHRSFPVLDGPLLEDLEAAVTRIESERPRGVLIAGRRPDQFLAGADVHAIRRVRDPRVVESVVRTVHRLYDRIEALPCTVVAAVGGPVPGGAFELCLACDTIVLANDPRTRIGLPETKLGLLPAWGGLHRLTRRVGVPTALDAILTGRLYDPRRAKRLGLVDRLTAPEYLERIGADLALGREPLAVHDRGRRAFFIDRNPLVRAVVGRAARKQLDEKTGGHYPAPYVVLEKVLEAPSVPRELWAEREAVAAGRLVATDACANLIDLFLGVEEQKRLGDGGERANVACEPAPKRIGVVGGGVMGAGIASALALAGADVRLCDLDRTALDRAVTSHRKAVAKRLRRDGSAARNAATDRLTVATELAGLGRSDLVIEAVAENLDVKRRVFAELERVAPNARLASNTSSLSIAELARDLARPERFVGLHFFNPVSRMPLVEIVRGTATDDATFRAAARIALDLGKTPVAVRDVPGFLVNRLLGPYLDEAVHRFVRGASVERVDLAAREFGMPMGPYELLDEVGLDIAQHASKSLFEGYGERMRPTEGLGRLVHPRRLGKKSGLGFYVHDARKKKRPRPAEDLVQFQGRSASSASSADSFDACLFALLAEAVRSLEEGVVGSARELDLAVVLGTGFAPFRGGPLRHIDSVGASEAVQRLEGLARAAHKAGHESGRARFEPPRLLIRMAERDETFFGVDRERTAGAA